MSKDFTNAKADAEHHQKQYNELSADYDLLKTEKGELEARHLRELGSYNDDLSNAKLDLISLQSKLNEQIDELKEQHEIQKKSMKANMKQKYNQK